MKFQFMQPFIVLKIDEMITIAIYYLNQVFYYQNSKLIHQYIILVLLSSRTKKGSCITNHLHASSRIFPTTIHSNNMDYR